jgi:hypothetical protein
METLNTVDLLIKVDCFVKMSNVGIIKSSRSKIVRRRSIVLSHPFQ